MDDNDRDNKAPAREDDYNAAKQTRTVAYIDTDQSVAKTLSRRRVVSGLLIVAVVAIVGLMMIMRSLPGSVFYRTKITVLEPAIESVQFTNHAKAAYHISLLARRLEEMKRLEARGPISEDALRELSGEMQKRFALFRTLVDGKGSKPLPQQDTVLLTSHAVSIIRAAERIAEAEPMPMPYGQEIEDLRRESVDVHEEKVREFSEFEDIQAVHDFIAEQLVVLESEISDENFPPALLPSVEDDIATIDQALDQNNLRVAVEAVMRAIQRTETNHHLSETSVAD